MNPLLLFVGLTAILVETFTFRPVPALFVKRDCVYLSWHTSRRHRHAIKGGKLTCECNAIVILSSSARN